MKPKNRSKTRNKIAIAAHFRNAGPMKDRRLHRQGNQQLEIEHPSDVDQYMSECDELSPCEECKDEETNKT